MSKTSFFPKGLPGDRQPHDVVARMIRVNHAGEYGAKRIYEGQLAVLGKTGAGPTLKHMAEQEQRHLDVFSKLLTERKVRPTALHPLWHAAGYALGVVTAFLGKEAAMACTVAVEEVIDGHYTRQLERLGEEEATLKAHITTFRDEEREHRDIGLQQGAEHAPAYPLLKIAVKTASHLAIWLSERV